MATAVMTRLEFETVEWRQSKTRASRRKHVISSPAARGAFTRALWNFHEFTQRQRANYPSLGRESFPKTLPKHPTLAPVWQCAVNPNWCLEAGVYNYLQIGRGDWRKRREREEGRKEGREERRKRGGIWLLHGVSRKTHPSSARRQIGRAALMLRYSTIRMSTVITAL